MFTENPRYYNRLLDAWDHKYSKKRDEGIAFLKGLCAKKIHLQVPPPTLEKVSFIVCYVPLFVLFPILFLFIIIIENKLDKREKVCCCAHSVKNCER